MKIAGSFFIIIASIVASYQYERYKQNEISCLKEIVDFLEFVKNQIYYFSLPLNRIYDEYTGKTDTVNKLISLTGDTATLLPMGDELLSCISMLGNGYKDEEIKALDYTIELINKEINTMQDVYKQKIKVFRAMSLFAGCCAIIMLV